MYQEHQLQLVLPSFSCFPVFFQFSSKVRVLILFFTFFQFYSVVCQDNKVHNSASSLFCCWLLLGLIVWPRLGDPFVSQNPRAVCVSHSPGQILGCSYTICSHGQLSIIIMINHYSLLQWHSQSHSIMEVFFIANINYCQWGIGRIKWYVQ